MRASAPGKLVLLGEYAVLEEGWALVAAVDRRAEGETGGETVSMSPLIRAVQELAGRKERLQIDTTGFYAGDKKLGLGSSAAVAVLAAGLITGKGDEATLELALRAHRKAQGGLGSGVDVMACFHGGVLAAKRSGQVEPLPSRMLGLNLFAFYVGESASTRELIAKCRAAKSWSERVRQMAHISEAGIDAWRKRDVMRFLQATAQYGRTMAALGRDAGAPVVTETTEALMRLAEQENAAAKPSGAGGGDIALVWSRDPETGQRIEDELDGAVELLDLAVTQRGLVLER